MSQCPISGDANGHFMVNSGGNVTTRDGCSKAPYMQLTIMFLYIDANRYRGSVQRPWLADWCSRWWVWLLDVDKSSSSLDVQTWLTGSTDDDCQDTITSFCSCHLHTASPCTRSLIQHTHNYCNQVTLLGLLLIR